jgi:Cdc6-like AAA superfamily ATPase
MSLFTLYTYSNIEELRKIQQEKEIIPFIFAETKDLLEYDSNICIDISTLIHFLQINKDNRYPAYINLREMTEETIVIVDQSLADDVINFFPYLFSSHVPFCHEENKRDKCEKPQNKFTNARQPIYTYHNVDDLTAIIAYANAHNIPITTFSRASGDLRAELEKFNKSAELALLDLTSTAYAIEDNKNLIYSVELFLNQFPNIKIIALTSQVGKIIKYFPFYVEDQKPIKDLLPDLKDVAPIENLDDKIKKITSLSTIEFNAFIEGFNHNLVGHEYFKDRFRYNLNNFIALNKVKEQKVLSIFLFGASGIGKTEVARLIANGLQQDSYLAKINFQNYSSQDSLNSLIGSPSGYIGCEHGELSDKVNKSKVGIVLCDEFEKTTRPVFSFFLELLEEGKFTDSMAREYDLDGYILIFTSNIQNESDYKKIIPLELQTRFDLVCEFQEPSYYEKTKFLDLLLKQAERKFADQFSQIQMTSAEKQQLYNFDYSSLNALRDIKRLFNSRLMDFFSSKGV